MSVLRQILFLDPSKHPYVVVSEKGNPVARFSNLPCAAQTVTLKHRRKSSTVITPQGDVLDRGMCQTIVDSHRTVQNYVSRPMSATEVMSGTR